MRNWPVFAGAAAVMAGLLAWAYLQNTPRIDARLARHLPESVSAVVAIDVAGLNRLGALPAIGAADAEYRRFTEQIGFQYQRDLESVIAGFDGPHTYVLATGRFSWERLRGYAESQGGSCQASQCRMPGSAEGRQVAWFPLESDVLALVSSPDANVVNHLSSAKAWAADAPAPKGVAWVTFRRGEALPGFLRTLASAFGAAERMTLWVDRQKGDLGIRVAARCREQKDASALASDLMAYRRGLFHATDRDVTGFWPLPASMLASILEER